MLIYFNITYLYKIDWYPHKKNLVNLFHAEK